MTTIQVNDHTIYYEAHGEGKPLILIASLGRCHSMWWKQIEPLGKRFRTVVFDNRGIGYSSPASSAYTISDLSQDTAALIRELDLAPCNVMGFAMGGFIALSMSLQHPELVDRLILVSTSAGGANHVPSSQTIMDAILNVNHEDIETYCRSLFPELAGEGYMRNHPEDLDRMVAHAQAKPLSPETLFFQLNAIDQLISGESEGFAVERITAPTLVLHGDEDRLVPPANGQYLADHIKGARLIMCKACGHLLPIEAADQLNTEVIAFLESEAE